MIHFNAALFLAIPLFGSAHAHPQKATGDVLVAQQQSTVSVPIYANPSCPIMGKPVSTRLFAETEKGRIYVCCKSCIKDIFDDLDPAYRTAFPTNKKIENTKCPVSGKEIKTDSPTVVLQGFEFFVADSVAVRRAREESQIVLAKLNDPKLTDLANSTCPVTGEATVKNAFVVIDGHLVRLSSPKLIEEIEKDPAKVLAKAKELRAKEEKERDAAGTGEHRGTVGSNGRSPD
ncbi:MAG: hypothetical protein ACKVWV_00645 [Planctomycetota bacterium]